jgi:hypothetical protein
MNILKLWQTPKSPTEDTEMPVIMRLAIVVKGIVN